MLPTVDPDKTLHTIRTRWSCPECGSTDFLLDYQETALITELILGNAFEDQTTEDRTLNFFRVTCEDCGSAHPGHEAWRQVREHV